MSMLPRPTTALGASVLLALAVGGAAVAQSPSVPPSAPPTAAVASPGAGPAVPVAVGPITWARVTKGKDFTNYPAVYGVGQLPDGQLVVLGSASPSGGGAAWVSADGSKWAKLKFKAPKGSSLVNIGMAGPTIVMTGIAGDGTGLVWTSADGSTWSDAAPMSGTIYGLTATPIGLAGVGVDGKAATAWTTNDGLTWTSAELAPSGHALHIEVGPDGTLLAAGAVTDTAGAATPVVWTSTDGATWTQTALDGMTRGSWSVPAAASTPSGFVVALVERAQSGSVGHVLTSSDGTTWVETAVDPNTLISVAGSAGTDAMLIGSGQVLRSPDGITWTTAAEPSFKGWTVRDVMQLADGRLFAAGDAGDAFGPSGSVMATWTGTAAPAP